MNKLWRHLNTGNLSWVPTYIIKHMCLHTGPSLDKFLHRHAQGFSLATTILQASPAVTVLSCGPDCWLMTGVH